MKHKSKKKVRLFYDQFLAGCSDEERNDSGRVRLAVSLGKNVSIVLDAGCGTGCLTRLLTKLARAAMYPNLFEGNSKGNVRNQLRYIL